MTTFSSLLAWSRYSSASGGRSRMGLLGSQPRFLKTASVIFMRHEESVGMRDHGETAPFMTLFDLSGTTRSGSISSRVPRPVQVGQAPCGELNEKLRGSSSSIVKPSYGQVYRSL